MQTAKAGDSTGADLASLEADTSTVNPRWNEQTPRVRKVRRSPRSCLYQKVPSNVTVDVLPSTRHTLFPRYRRSVLPFPPCFVEKKMAVGPNRDELRTWSQYIRDTLIPELKDGTEVALATNIIEVIRTFLYELRTTHIDVDVLRYSRLHSALKEICMMADRWPTTITLPATALLKTWEIKYGPLNDITADLWGPGGRLEGLIKLTGSGRLSRDGIPTTDSSPVMAMIRPKSTKSSWSVEGRNGPFHAFRIGHIGFNVGEYVRHGNQYPLMSLC